MNALRPVSSGWLDATGTIGTLVAGACCLGFAPLLGLFGAVGLGFLINDAILLPSLAIFLGVTAFGLWKGYTRHGGLGPAALGSGAAVGLLVFLFLWVLQAVAYLMMGLLVIAAVWNRLARHRCGMANRSGSPRPESLRC